MLKMCEAWLEVPEMDFSFHELGVYVWGLEAWPCLAWLDAALSLLAR